MLLASCMRASSAGDLMLRQPKVMGVALVAVRVGLAWAMPSAKTNWVRSSMPILPVVMPDSLRALARSCVGVFVFVPGVDARGGGGGERCGLGFHALADAAFFEDGADDEGAALGGEGPGEEALGLAPAEAGEVGERGAGGDDDGVDFVLVHEGAGAFEALLALGEGDGDGFGAAVGEGGDGGWEFGSADGATLGVEREVWTAMLLLR